MPVYFIQAGKDGPIKIGSCTHAPSRRSNIQSHNPEPIRIAGLVQGGFILEMRLHSHFRKLHIRGEWFRCEDELKELVQRFNRAPHDREAWPRHRIKFRKGGAPFLEKVTRYREFTAADKKWYREILGRKMANEIIEKHEMRPKRIGMK